MNLEEAHLQIKEMWKAVKSKNEIAQLILDLWIFLKNHWQVKDTDEYWEQVVKDQNDFYKKYKCDFAIDLIFACTNELERRVKKMREM
ncbi:MAG: hypothetical protein FWE25_03415 [Lachnospiraceae bacterium]|nr:hypothetical protein [Lachnospiraceae bacterium]